MDFLVLSRPAIERGLEIIGDDGKPLLPPKHIVISITNPYDDNGPAKIKDCDSCQGILRLSFYDIVDISIFAKNERVFYTPNLFKPEDARKILKFVNEHEDKIEMIICHCQMGRSRSAGVAAALSKIMTGDDQFFFKHFDPNRLVHKTILDEAQAAQSDQPNQPDQTGEKI